MTSSPIDPPEHVPEEVVNALRESNDRQLRETIHFAQQLVREHQSVTDAIEAREGEELVSTEEYKGSTIVIVERPGETGDERGPFAYRVKWEPAQEGAQGRYRWHYLGRVGDVSGGR